MNIDDDFLSTKLLQYQLPHLQNMVKSFENNQVIIDASDTGTGKTYTTIALMKMFNKKPLIVCPKSVINSWINVSKYFNVEIVGVTNYEALKSRKMYKVNTLNNNIEYCECPYIDKVPDDSGEDSDDEKKSKKDKKDEKYKFLFQIPEEEKDKFVFVFDEAHKGKNANTSNSKILIASQLTGQKVVLLSATISDKIKCFKPFGYLFGFYQKLSSYNIWFRRQLMVHKVIHDKTDWSDDQKKLDIIHRRIFPKYGSRMKISLLGDLFPKNQIISEAYYLANHEEINKLYEEINSALADLKIKELRAEALGKLIRCRQHIEILKIPIFLELAEEAIDNGYSVAIFVNFHETMQNIAYQLDADCFIHGKQSLEERIECIEDFQSNRKNVIIAIIQAGGVGVSLHDLHGKPRMSIISPTWSGQDLVQCLGRIHRAGSKTPAQQKIVFCAKTYEERICELIQSKLTNISGINDGDLIGPKFDQAYIELIDNEFKSDTTIEINDEIKKIIKKKVVKKRSVKNIKNEDNVDI